MAIYTTYHCSNCMNSFDDDMSRFDPGECDLCNDEYCESCIKKCPKCKKYTCPDCMGEGDHCVVCEDEEES